VFSVRWKMHRSFCRKWQFLCLSSNSPYFMELKGSLPCSQGPATCPYP
jgi:hypothetical protein